MPLPRGIAHAGASLNRPVGAAQRLRTQAFRAATVYYKRLLGSVQTLNLLLA